MKSAYFILLLVLIGVFVKMNEALESQALSLNDINNNLQTKLNK